MTKPCRPDFSPAVLQAFIKIRTACIKCEHSDPACRKCQRRHTAELRKRSGLSTGDMKLAATGKLKDAGRRVRLWGAMDIVPAEYGIQLLDDGGQERA